MDIDLNVLEARAKDCIGSIPEFSGHTVLELIRRLRAAEEQLAGSEERCRMLFDAKNQWADRARDAECIIGLAGCPMSPDHIHIMDLPVKPRTCLFYYQGNFFHQLDLPGQCVGLVKGAIRKFMKTNKALVERDRAHPDYKPLTQLFDEQMASV